jgi:hypothetical protein
VFNTIHEHNLLISPGQEFESPPGHDISTLNPSPRNLNLKKFDSRIRPPLGLTLHLPCPRRLSSYDPQQAPPKVINLSWQSTNVTLTHHIRRQPYLLEDKRKLLSSKEELTAFIHPYFQRLLLPKRTYALQHEPAVLTNGAHPSIPKRESFPGSPLGCDIIHQPYALCPTLTAIPAASSPHFEQLAACPKYMMG